MSRLVVGTRGSDLALWQARWVAQRLGGEGAEVAIEVIRTEGDRAMDADLSASGDRGLFTRDIERALLDRRVDLAVHSLKDLPTLMPAGLMIAAVPPRASVHDVLLVRPESVDETQALPVAPGARIGTGSPRRVAQLVALRPDVVTGPFRGNVPTRVDKARRGDVDAVVLACAGLERLALDASPLVAFDFAPEAFLPAPAQGALGIQARADDAATLARLAALDHAPTRACVEVERDLLRILEAGCHAALGAWARVRDGALTLDAGMLVETGAFPRVRASGEAATLARIAADALLSDEAEASAPARLVTRRA